MSWWDRCLMILKQHMYLCISVPTGDDAKLRFLQRLPYIVNTEYAGGTPDGGVAGKAMVSTRWAASTRDGTTVHIPYLTTWADYNQRIVVSNRSANEVLVLDHVPSGRRRDGYTRHVCNGHAWNPSRPSC